MAAGFETDTALSLSDKAGCSLTGLQLQIRGRAAIDGAVTRSRISMAYSPYDRLRLPKIAAA
jgi:hypothetical protein